MPRQKISTVGRHPATQALGVGMWKIFAVPSSDPVSTIWPSGLTTSAWMPAVCPVHVRTHWPASTSASACGHKNNTSVTRSGPQHQMLHPQLAVPVARATREPRNGNVTYLSGGPIAGACRRGRLKRQMARSDAEPRPRLPAGHGQELCQHHPYTSDAASCHGQHR